MNTEQQSGYFSEQQCDRMNLKTMANPLTAPWNGHHLLSLLVYTSDLAVATAGVSPDEAKQQVTEWYCTSTVEEVVEALESMSKEPTFQAILQFQEMVHRDPEALERALKAVEDGWRPE